MRLNGVQVKSAVWLTEETGGKNKKLVWLLNGLLLLFNFAQEKSKLDPLQRHEKDKCDCVSHAVCAVTSTVDRPDYTWEEYQIRSVQYDSSNR